jgi:hypothetical protein
VVGRWLGGLVGGYRGGWVDWWMCTGVGRELGKGVSGFRWVCGEGRVCVREEVWVAE